MSNVCKCGWNDEDIFEEMNLDEIDEIFSKDEAKCPICESSLKWTVKERPSGKVREIDATFDYSSQTWRDASGNVLEPNSNWDMGCIYCHGPAEYTGHNHYYEYYKCLECNSDFKIN